MDGASPGDVDILTDCGTADSGSEIDRLISRESGSCDAECGQGARFGRIHQFDGALSHRPAGDAHLRIGRHGVLIERESDDGGFEAWLDDGLRAGRDQKAGADGTGENPGKEVVSGGSCGLETSLPEIHLRSVHRA